MNRSYTNRIATKAKELAERRRRFLLWNGFKHTDEQLTYTNEGWPRPVSAKYGLRVPWVSPAEQLKRTHPDRMTKVVEYALCQVCGEDSPADEAVFVLVNGEVSDHPKDVDLAKKTVQAMDNAVMHWRCMRLATGQCPELRRLREAGNLYVFVTKHDKIMIFTDPDTDERVLGVDGEFVEYVSWDDIHGKLRAD